MHAIFYVCVRACACVRARALILSLSLICLPLEADAFGAEFAQFGLLLAVKRYSGRAIEFITLIA